jgi:hypothetical protein
MYVYIYIYIERERERICVKHFKTLVQDMPIGVSSIFPNEQNNIVQTIL